MIKFNKYRISYKCTVKGFMTYVEVSSNNIENALKQAKKLVNDCYGTYLFKKMLFDNPILIK